MKNIGKKIILSASLLGAGIFYGVLNHQFFEDSYTKITRKFCQTQEKQNNSLNSFLLKPHVHQLYMGVKLNQASHSMMEGQLNITHGGKNYEFH